MGARGCLGPLLLLLLSWAEHRGRGSGVASAGSGSVAGAGGDRTWLQPSIIGGHEAEQHSRPYMVSIQLGGYHRCGGALLHQRWVLTAAHCQQQGWKKAQLVVGLHNWRRPEEKTKRFAVRAACPHPDYDPEKMENDLLLLQLDGKVTLSKTRRLISLAKREPKPGTQCSVAGWGVTDSKGRSLSPTLKEMEVEVMDARMCNNSRFWKGEIGPTMICFQGQERGSAPAKGDSGGPLVCGKRPAVAGVISFGGKNATNLFKPPVATSTVKHNKWIQKTLRKGCGSGQLKHTAQT